MSRRFAHLVCCTESPFCKTAVAKCPSVPWLALGKVIFSGGSMAGEVERNTWAPCSHPLGFRTSSAFFVHLAFNGKGFFAP